MVRQAISRLETMQPFLRHALATVAYRGGKTVRNAPAEFSKFQAGPSSRTAGQILAHIGDLLDWGLSLARASSAGRTPRRRRGKRTSRGFTRASRHSTRPWLRGRRSGARRRSSFKARLPTRSPTSVKSACSGGSPARPSKARTTSGPTSKLAASARIRPAEAGVLSAIESARSTLASLVHTRLGRRADAGSRARVGRRERRGATVVPLDSQITRQRVSKLAPPVGTPPKLVSRPA